MSDPADPSPEGPASLWGVGPWPSHWVIDGGDRLAEVVSPVRATSPVPDVPLVLSRFAWLRRETGGLVAESARGPGRVTLVDARASSLVLRFSTPQSIEEAIAAGAVSAAAARELASSLLACGVLIVSGEDDEDELPLAVWEFHDLLFHARSRSGRHGNPAGGTYRFADRIAPAPALAPPRWSPVVSLQRPDFERLERDDPPLSAVQAARRSVRAYGEAPIDVGQLGEFLYRAARVDDLWLAPGPDPAHPTDVAARPYPSGGALYELECYLVAHRCSGLEAGLYHYEPGEHALERVLAASPELSELTARGGMGAGLAARDIQVLVLITARMHRIAWKYASLAYALVLKHVGVLMDTMYLAATAMGLAPCAIGGGDSDLFARVSGIAYYEEPLVGEFALGSLPAA